jgi:hypothetical protein
MDNLSIQPDRLTSLSITAGGREVRFKEAPQFSLGDRQ